MQRVQSSKLLRPCLLGCKYTWITHIPLETLGRFEERLFARRVPQRRHSIHGLANAVRSAIVPIALLISFVVSCRRGPHSDQTITLKLPASSLDLGTPPRLCYPLVIFLFRTDNEEDLHPDETVNRLNALLNRCLNFIRSQVALVNVVHVKDSVCTLPTSILAQYLKQANGQLSCLKVGNGIFFYWERHGLYT